jgi:MFS family permease
MSLAPTQTAPHPARYRWLILAVLFTARVVLAFQFQSLAAIGPVLVRSLAIDYGTLGTLVGLFMLPGVLVALPGGILGQRFGDKRMVVVGLAMMVAGGACVALAPSTALVATGRLLSGTGAVLLNILLAKMVTDWFSDRDIVLAMALFVSSWPVGIGLALVLLPPLVDAAGSAVALGSTAAASGAALLLVAWAYRTPAGLVPAKPSFRLGLNAREWGLSILSGLVWALYNVGFIVVLVFGPSLLTAQGLPVGAAGATVSLVTWTILLSLPLGGYLAQRVNSPDVVMVGCFIALALLAASLPSGLPPLLLCAAFGLLAGPPAGLIMALPGSVLRPGNRSAGMGVFYTCYYAAMAGLVPLAGVLRDATRNAEAPLYFAAAMLVGAAAALGLFRALHPRERPAAA